MPNKITKGYLIIAVIYSVLELLDHILHISYSEAFGWTITIIRIINIPLVVLLIFLLSPLFFIYILVTNRRKVLLVIPSYLVIFFILQLSFVQDTAIINALDIIISAAFDIFMIGFFMYSLKNERILAISQT